MRDFRSTATDIQDLLCLALKKNIGVNTALTTYLQPKMLSVRIPSVGFTVAQHLVHLCNDVKHWAGHVESEGASLLPTLAMPGEQDRLSLEWVEQVQRTWNDAEWLVIKLISDRRSSEKGDLPHTGGVGMYAIHLLVHDSYHRGQMVAALKAAGYTMPDPDASLWSPWRS